MGGCDVQRDPLSQLQLLAELEQAILQNMTVVERGKRLLIRAHLVAHFLDERVRTLLGRGADTADPHGPASNRPDPRAPEGVSGAFTKGTSSRLQGPHRGEALGAAMPLVEQPTDPDLRVFTERRSEPRWPCRRGHVCRVLVRPSFQTKNALILDLSTGGIGLILAVPLEEGQQLAIQLPLVREDTSETHRARVVHVRRHEEWGWVHGCCFDRPLSEEELLALT